jgi:uncharacterized repeat protein (TIGR03806 family)
MVVGFFGLLGVSSLVADNKLSGTIIGTPGSWNNSGNTREKAMDGSLTTFFDGPDPGTNEWVGLDLGAGTNKIISQVRYCPRANYPGRMVGGKFQGANAGDFSDAIDLFTVTAAPAQAALTAQTVTITNAFRYVRYRGPDPSWCNVAEIEFYESGPAAPPPIFGAFRELWTNLDSASGNTLAVLTNTVLNPNWPTNPAAAYTQVVTNFETATNTGLNNYGQRLRAYIVPPASGGYSFWIASDDASELLLSSDENSSHATRIAWVSVWTDPREWTKEPNQKSALIPLEAGRRYYAEARMRQGGGGDCFGVRWQLPDSTFEEPIGALSAAGTRLIPCPDIAAPPGIYLQPTNIAVAEHFNARFALLATNQAALSYQWQLNSTNLPGVTNPVCTMSNVNGSLNGQTFRCIVSNAIAAVTSAPAMLTVLADTNAPTLISAANYGLTNVAVQFSEPVEQTTATNATNYSILGGVTISSIALSDAQTVSLRVSPLTLGSNYTVRVSNVRDLADVPNVILTNSQISFTAQAYGLVSRGSIGTFLNGQMPEAAPLISGNWSAVVAFTNLIFTNALGLAAVPGTSNLIVWEREGRIYSFSNTPSAATKMLVLDISNQCQGWDDSGLLNVVFHPGFATNRFMFVYYTWVTPGTVVGSPTVRPTEQVIGKYHDRLSRFTIDSGGLALPGSELVLVDQTGDSVWHNGSGMFFHPTNGFLYYTDGDDERAPTQIINGNLFSGVFRIDVDMRGGSISHAIPRQPANGTTANYFIPNDNPFVGQSNVLGEFFALGLRSPHRMTYDAASGRIFIADVGAGSREELDIVEPGDPFGLNFQWSRIEGLAGDLTPPYIGVNKRPALDYNHSEGQAIIGGYVYRGAEFAADLGGKYIFGDNVQKKVWVLDETTTPPGKILLCVMPAGSGPNSGSDYTGLSSFGLDQNNELHLCQMSSVGGRIYKLARSGPPPASRPFPPLLSQTGAFADVTSLTPTNGLIPYTVNSPLWSDAAIKSRWLALPTNTFVHFTPTGEWSFPNGAVFVKHFDLPVSDIDPNVTRRVETRLLVRDTNGTVYGITYKWRTNYTDADVVTNAVTEDIRIQTATGSRTQQWFYPGPTDCLRCHLAVAGHVLGVKTRQLNGSFNYPESGVTDNQLRAWNHIGLFDTNVQEAAIANYDHLVSVTNMSASLELRARSYLDANCGQCHRPGGAPAFWDARFDTPLTNQNIINGSVANSLGISGARVVAPQDLAKSLLYVRANSVEPSIKMPPLARNTIDSNAVSMLADWISSLPGQTGSLVARYQFENDTLDSSGHSNDGVASGGVSFVTGKVATALSTDGTNGYVRVPLSISNDFTIAFWLKTTATGGSGQWWAGKGLVDGEVAGASADFGTTLVGDRFAFGVGNPDTTITSTTAINDGAWHHLTATRDGGTGEIKIYVDTVLEATDTASASTRSGPPYLRIGSLQSGTAAGYIGATFDDVRFYDFVLNATQVAGLANTPPVLAAISNQTILAGRTLSITNNATDADSPPQLLTYSLINPPIGAAIDASNGIFGWRPAIAQSATTNLLSVRVSDNGTPSQSATQSFLVTVMRPVAPGLYGATITTGRFELLISGDSGPDYTVQVSTNLLNWSSLWTTSPSVAPFWFNDPAAGNYPQRYYRVLLGP